MIKHSGLKITSIILTALIFLSCFTAVSYATAEQNKAQLSVTASNKNPSKGDTVTVTVNLINVPRNVAAMSVTVEFDASCFEYKSSKKLVELYDGDAWSLTYNGKDKVSFAYTYANNNKYAYPTSDPGLFSFKLSVKNTVSAKKTVPFVVSDLTIYDDDINLVKCSTPKTDEVTVWPSKPDILFNDSEKNLGTYNENVTVSFDSRVCTLSYNGRPAEQITSPYTCDKNGTYTVAVKVGSTKVQQTFTIKKEIKSISVMPGTFQTDYPQGTSPDYSSWTLLVAYANGTSSEIPMDDPDIEITGFDSTKIGDQQLTIKYMETQTHLNVSVNTKKVVAFSIKNPIEKTEYLVGEDIDPKGGVLLVIYDDGLSEEVNMTKSMFSGYDKTHPGDQEVTLSYAGESKTIRIKYISRDDVDSLVHAIDELDLNAITADSKDLLLDLRNKYMELSATQKKAVTNVEKLNEALERYNEIVFNGGGIPIVTETEEAVSDEESTQDSGSGGKPRSTKFIWIIVGVIIVLSVIGGIVYFIVIYFKRKKEVDEDEYYDDGDYDDESDDDGDLSYEEDIIDADEDKDIESDNEPKTEIHGKNGVISDPGQKTTVIGMEKPIAEKAPEKKISAEEFFSDDEDDDDEGFGEKLVIIDDDDETEDLK